MLSSERRYRGAAPPTISAESLVIAYVSPKVMRAVYVKDDPDHVVQFTTGTYHAQDWIGKVFGCAVYPRKRRPNLQPLYLLLPTPELWTRVLSHRTQILYLADISMICTFLELKPGCSVLESGHVHTFEFHPDRCDAALEEFNRHGLSETVTVTQRDVQCHGFPEDHHHKAHGVFLDLPEPWKAVSSAVTCLIPGHCIVTFSPCIEQIQRTCEALRATEDVIDLRIMECIAQEYRVKGEPLATDLQAYHAVKSAGQSSSGPHREVVNTRVVSLKGHTGFLVVGRRFARHSL